MAKKISPLSGVNSNRGYKPGFQNLLSPKSENEVSMLVTKKNTDIFKSKIDSSIGHVTFDSEQYKSHRFRTFDRKGGSVNRRKTDGSFIDPIKHSNSKRYDPKRDRYQKLHLRLNRRISIRDEPIGAFSDKNSLQNSPTSFEPSTKRNSSRDFFGYSNIANKVREE